MKKILKVFSVFKRKLIFLFDGLNNKIFTKLYTKYLINLGVKIEKYPNYISSTAYIDGLGYDLIHIGKDVVISREVMLLTHDFSIETAFHSVGKGTENRVTHINLPISIGENSFIGARASLLPGTKIGKNCIIGACTVVKGEIPDNSVVIGNPSKIIGFSSDIAQKYGNLIKF